MPTILDPGTTRLSNADVLAWIAAKRLQHTTETASDASAKKKKTPQPDNFVRALRKHERELKGKKYPYTLNPGAYGTEESRERSVRMFLRMVDERIIAPAEAAADEEGRALGESKLTREKRVKKVQELKTLTEGEVLQVVNLAPQCTEIMGCVVESWEERFTGEEMEGLVEVCGMAFRCGEVLPEEER
jgi:repressor of nif and glnA expression